MSVPEIEHKTETVEQIRLRKEANPKFWLSLHELAKGLFVSIRMIPMG